MNHLIKHFMWGYQPHFRVGRQVAAEQLFKKLDQRLRPEVFVVGILSDGSEGKFPACVEPEEEYWIESEAFNDVLASSAKLREGYPEARMFQSHPLAQQRQDEDLLKRSIQDAIRNVIQSHPSRPSHLTFQVSYPAKVDCYWVSVVLGLQTSVVSAHPSLQRSSVKIHECRYANVPVSLVDAAAAEFLQEGMAELLRPDPGLSITHRDSDELLRSAGARLVSGVVWRVDQNCIEGMHGLFRSLTTVSSLRYEKAPGAGRILLARRHHPAVAEKVSLSEPVKLDAYRSIRKLLELASDELPLYGDPDQIYGLAQKSDYDSTAEDLFEIQILGHHYWELRHAANVLMRVQYGLPTLPRLSFNEDKFRTDLPRIFQDITPAQIDRLVELVKVAGEESHGTMLVITEAASAEAARLASQGTVVTPLRLDADILRNLTPIDGAIILEPAGMCHAIGVVLDGRATQHGDPGRGARYNSAVRYYESIGAPCVIVVVSSDGGIDFVPNPSRAIRRSRIDAAIETMVGFERAKRISRRLYQETLDWLDAHRFYLNEADCRTLNRLVPALDKRIRDEEQATIWIVRRAFEPNPDMHPALYYVRE